MGYTLVLNVYTATVILFDYGMVHPKQIAFEYFDLQPQIRRSFVRELLALIPNLDTEFSGQIKLLSFDEMNTNEVLLEITPLKGYYAHASFVFRVSVSRIVVLVIDR